MISTHVLDTTHGAPAEGVAVELEMQASDGTGSWSPIAAERTNKDGRIAFQCPARPGTYRLTFRVEPYFKSRKIAAFFTEAPIVFQITDTARKYHVPLLLNPYGYSTYRGS